jgi:hypothetical protein
MYNDAYWEYDLPKFKNKIQLYIVQESFLGSLIYYTISWNEIWEISKTFLNFFSRPLPLALRSASFLSFAMVIILTV